MADWTNNMQIVIYLASIYYFHLNGMYSTKLTVDWMVFKLIEGLIKRLSEKLVDVGWLVDYLLIR